MSRSTVIRKAEAVANVVTIIVALLLGGVLAKRYFFAGPRAGAPPVSENRIFTDGRTKLPLPEVDWKRGELTLVLVLNEKCQVCLESSEFHRRLTEVARDSQIPVVAALPGDVSESQRFLSSSGLSVPEVRRASHQAMGLLGTPAVVLVNGEGVIVEAWVGKLPAEEEAIVVERLRSKKSSPAVMSEGTVEGLDPDWLEGLLGPGSHVVLLDVRGRADYREEHISGALNIPYDELEVRAVNEMDTSDVVVAYSRWGDPVMPEDACHALRAFGFSKVYVLKGGLDRWRQSGLSTGAGGS
jgi:rhodanese-related sulfurtransferase